MQSRLFDGFSLIELCFAIFVLGLSILAIAPISKISLSAKNSQDTIKDIAVQKRIMATGLNERFGGIQGLGKLCKEYGIACTLSSQKSPDIVNEVLNLTLPATPVSPLWQKL